MLVKLDSILLRRAKPTLSPLPCGHLALDFDVFTLDNSGTTKEGVAPSSPRWPMPAPPGRSTGW